MRRAARVVLTGLVAFNLSLDTARADALGDAVGAGDADATLAALAGVTDPKALTRPLYFAARDGHGEIVALLLDNGADPNAALSFGTPLRIAARNGHAGIVALLLENGADPNATSGEQKQAALHDAAELGRLATAELLLRAGADVTLRNVKNHAPLHLAVLKERGDMADWLRANGAGAREPARLSEGELDAADLALGRTASLICTTCHEVEPGVAPTGRHHGPTLVGVFGREKATLEDYPYSRALAAETGGWTADALFAYVSDPTGTVPGTKMQVTPDLDRAQRVAVVAYLRDRARR